MRYTMIKVCGITTPEDAAACQALGVDHLGVIFAPGPRTVTASRAREIRGAVPGASLVGVFADEDPSRIVEICDLVGLDIVQLHGRETPEYCARLAAEAGLPLLKALCPAQTDDAGVVDAYGALPLLLFDLDKRSPNGIGAVRSLWSETARASRSGRRVYLAGGLTPLNVREAVRLTKPYGVDVCRGVEREPGIKDPKQVREFVQEVRR